MYLDAETPFNLWIVFSVFYLAYMKAQLSWGQGRVAEYDCWTKFVLQMKGLFISLYIF